MYDNTNCPIQIEVIPSTDCIGDSLDALNNNFDTLNGVACDLAAQAQETLTIEDQGYMLPGITTVLNFSGGQVDVFTTPAGTRDNLTDRKTVYIPLTGVLSLTATETVVDDTLLFPRIEIDSYTGPLSGEGHVAMRIRTPNPPRQIRTFYFYGSNTTATSNMQDATNSYPSTITITSFVNNPATDPTLPGLDLPSVSRDGDLVWVIYQKTAYTTGRSGAFTLATHNHTYTTTATTVKHVHSMPNTDTRGDHTHSTGSYGHGNHNHPTDGPNNKCGCRYCRTGTTSSNPHAGHDGATIGTIGNHYHTNPNTDEAGEYTFTFAGTVNNRTDEVKLPDAVIDRYYHTIIKWQLRYKQSTNSYQMTQGPFFIQSKGTLGANVPGDGSWNTPTGWTTY